MIDNKRFKSSEFEVCNLDECVFSPDTNDLVFMNGTLPTALEWNRSISSAGTAANYAIKKMMVTT